MVAASSGGALLPRVAACILVRAIDACRAQAHCSDALEELVSGCAAPMASGSAPTTSCRTQGQDCFCVFICSCICAVGSGHSEEHAKTTRQSRRYSGRRESCATAAPTIFSSCNSCFASHPHASGGCPTASCFCAKLCFCHRTPVTAATAGAHSHLLAAACVWCALAYSAALARAAIISLLSFKRFICNRSQTQLDPTPCSAPYFCAAWNATASLQTFLCFIGATAVAFSAHIQGMESGESQHSPAHAQLCSALASSGGHANAAHDRCSTAALCSASCAVGGATLARVEAQKRRAGAGGRGGVRHV
jgi:hypothetical protein